MRQPLTIGSEDPNRPGYYLMGFSRSVRHSRSSRVIRPKTARAFPLWRKLDHPPCKQLSLLDLL
jgi:hypothetical protein